MFRMQIILVFLCVTIIASAIHLPNNWNTTYSSYSTHHSESTQKPHPTSNQVKHYHLLLNQHSGNNSINLCDFESTRGHYLCDRFYPSSCFPPICTIGPNGELKWYKNKCYLEQHNRVCSTRFARVDDNKCDAKTKPSVDTKPCPISNDIEACVAGTIVHEVGKHCSCH